MSEEADRLRRIYAADLAAERALADDLAGALASIDDPGVPEDVRRLLKERVLARYREARKP